MPALIFSIQPIYMMAGKNEKLVGKALKENREEIILATKVGNKLNPDGKVGHGILRKSISLKQLSKV